MTKKVSDVHPPLPVRERSVAESSDEFSGHTPHSFDISAAYQSSFNQPLQHGPNGHLICQPMYSFGSEMKNPGNYSCSPPLRPALHFTAPRESMEQSRCVGNRLSAYINEEFAATGYCEDFPDDFASPSLVAATQELETQLGTTFTYAEYTPKWTWQQPSPLQASYNNLWRANVEPLQFAAHNFFHASPREPQSTPLTPTQAAITSQPNHRHIRPKDKRARDAPPDEGDSHDVFKGGGRKRALSPDARAAAQRIRIMGACGRCHAKKEKCDEQRPCKPCLGKNKRSLDFPCCWELPADRYLHLSTEGMYGHLELRKGEFFKSLPSPDSNAQNKPFLLRLHQYFDDPELEIPVIQFKPKSSVDVNKSIFPIASNGKDYEVQPTNILSPPLVPAMNNDNIIRFTKRFRQSAMRWLECAESHEDIEWHLTFFREEYGKPWPRAVFADVCKFYHEVTMAGCPALKSSLQATVLVYMLGHSFYIPEEDLASVMERTHMGPYDGNFRFVSPIHVDRFLKALLFQMFRATLKLAFDNYQDLASPNKHTRLSRDRIMAVSIVLLIVAGSQQSKVVEKAVARDRRGQKVDKKEVYAQIQEIEEWINDMIVQIWEYKFNCARRWAEDDPENRKKAYQAKRFDLVERFRKSYEAHREDLEDLSTVLPQDISITTFGTTNIDRLLKRFYLAVFSQKEQERPVSRGRSSHNSFEAFFVQRQQEAGSLSAAKREPHE